MVNLALLLASILISYIFSSILSPIYNMKTYILFAYF